MCTTPAIPGFSRVSLLHPLRFFFRSVLVNNHRLASTVITGRKLNLGINDLQKIACYRQGKHFELRLTGQLNEQLSTITTNRKSRSGCHCIASRPQVVNFRGNINGIEKGFSARGPQQPNYAFGSPKVAMQELFKSVANNKDARVKYELERKVLEFAAKNEGGLASHLAGLEQSKIKNYAESIESIRKRNKKIDGMADVIRKHVPKLDEKYLSDDLSTVDRQMGHTEILLSTLISGMTNVVTFTVDELGTPYTGLADIEKETVNLHDVGHGKSVGAFKAVEVREKLRRHHMSLVDTIVKRLKAVPEDGGTMFDNTMVFYFPDNGETHHSHGTEWPFIVMAGNNCKLDVSGKYIRLPKYGDKGHKTLGNWYTTILNAYGNPTPHYGDFDTGLTQYGINQSGAIQQFLG